MLTRSGDGLIFSEKSLFSRVSEGSLFFVFVLLAAPVAAFLTIF